MKAPKMIVAGLGNPGPEFSSTYHNAGRLALEALATRLGAPDDSGNASGAAGASGIRVGGASAVASGRGASTWKSHRGLFSYAIADGIALVSPLTYMNESGAAVGEALKKFGAKPSALIVLHDESDLPVGQYKISAGRGAAGHRGVQSIMDTVRTKEFTRIRIGIRPPRERTRRKASAFVLKPVSASDRAVFAEVFAKIADEIVARAAA